MPLPKLSAEEKRLGKFAGLCSTLYALAGLFFAAFPGWTFELATLGASPSQPGPEVRFWQVLAVSGMAALSLACALVARAPRERRALLLPVLAAKFTSGALALVALLGGPPGGSSRTASRPLLLLFLADFALLVATLWLYRAAAPGVNLAPIAQGSPEPQAGPTSTAPVRLGASARKG